jgi:hypothetical protein
VDTVEDSSDSYLAYPPSTPATLTLGSFTFRGLIQKYESRRGPDGNPVQTTIVVDPREILAGTKIILNGYTGSVATAKNIINPYAFWEIGTGFGSAQVNETGMPWSLVRSAIEFLTTNTGFDYLGAPLVYAGWQYSVDLSELPSISSSYRISGNSASLLDIISQVAQNGGYAFHIDLSGFIIRVRVVSTISQPPLGTLTAFINAQDGVSTNSRGLEARNEITSAFLVGGEATDLTFPSGSNIAPFWGLDIDGNVIIGTGTGNDHVALLNASPVGDILGTSTYECSVRELRFAMAGQDWWETFVNEHKPTVATTLNLNCTWELGQDAGVLLKPDFLNLDQANVQAMGAAAITADQNMRQNRMYEFVRKYAQDYYGKRFLARIPDVSIAQESQQNAFQSRHK